MDLILQDLADVGTANLWQLALINSPTKTVHVYQFLDLHSFQFLGICQAIRGLFAQSVNRASISRFSTRLLHGLHDGKPLELVVPPRRN